MKLNRFEDANQFYDRVKDYLLEREAEHFLLLRICNSLIHHPEQHNNSQSYLATVEAQRNIIAVAMRTPPHNLVLSKVKNLATLEIIARDLYSDRQQIPGVNALSLEAESFARQWQVLTGQSYKLWMKLRIHQLEKVQPIAKVKGYLRLSRPSDRPLLLNWFEAFATEALGAVEEDTERVVDRHLSQKSLYLWQDELPVSMAVGREATPNGASIGPVYTPPAYRQRGYASSCVAALSQTLLDRGCRYCFLFTDLANPTSNHIYQTIGYQPVCDWGYYRDLQLFANGNQQSTINN